MPKAYRSTLTAIAIHREDTNPVYGEETTIVRIEDEGGGPFFILSQSSDDGERSIRLDYDEFKLISQSAEILLNGWPRQVTQIQQ
jgi:hypothetical protein